MSSAPPSDPGGDEQDEQFEASEAPVQGQPQAFKADEAPAASTLRPDEIEARAEAKAKRDADEKTAAEAKAVAEAKAKRDADEKAAAEAKAKRDADEKAAAEAKAKRDADEKAAAEAKAKRDADEKAEAKSKAEAQAEADAKARAKRDAEDKARAEADAKAKREAEARAKVEAKKGAPAKVDEKRGPKGEPVNVKKVTIKAKDEEPSGKHHSAHGLDDDPSSISAEFFRKDEDSVPPVEEGEEVAAQHLVALSPTTLARRARLRRVVAAVVAFAGVISIAVVGKTVAASKRPTTGPLPAVVQEPKKAETKPTQAPAPLPPPTATPAKVDEKKADEPAKVDEKKADEKKADEPAKVDEKKADEKPTADAAALRKETESLLNRGKRKEAIEKAKEAIAADPSEAMPYLFLGSALQDVGKYKEGIDAYSECVRHATKGPVHECRAMGGKK